MVAERGCIGVGHMTMFGGLWGLRLIGVSPLAKLVAIRLGDGCNIDASGSTDLSDLAEWCGAEVSGIRAALAELEAVGVAWCEIKDGALSYQLPDSARPEPRADAVKRDAPAWLYIIRGRLGLKIGITTSLEKRVENLRSVTLDDSVSLLWSERGWLSVIRRAERMAHDALAAKRIRNEWFSVSLEEAQATVVAALDAARKGLR